MKRRLLFLLMCVCFICNTACASKKDSSNEQQMETIVDSNIGEGAPSSELIEVDEERNYNVGDKILMESDISSYELTIDSVSYIEASNEHAEKPKHVVLIDYTYTNNSEELLLIDSMYFQLINEEKEIYEPYYFDGKVTADIAEKGKSVSAQIAFAQNDDETHLVLVYQDITNSDMEPISVEIDEISEKD